MWPLYIGALLVLLNVAIYFMDVAAGGIISIFLGIYAILLVLLLFYYKPAIVRNLIDFAASYSQVQKKLLKEFAIPYGLLDENGNLMWLNDELLKIIEKPKNFKKNITNIFPEVSIDMLPAGDEIKEIRIKYNNRDYKIEFHKIYVDLLADGVDVIEADEDASFIAMYLFDETDINMYIQKIRDERFVAGLIYIDNFEETFNSIDDVRRSLFLGIVDRKVNKYFSNGAGIVRKLEKDKYMAVFRYHYLEQLKEDKFSLLEDVKAINIGNDMIVTVSMGIGTGGNDYAKNYDIAKTSMDLALGRGGDQVVIKDGEKITYFGGKSQQIEKNTRVKSRVKAHALQHILMNNDKILIMGHKTGDVDSFGSAIGLYRAAKKLDKTAHIVFNEVTTSVKPFMDRFKNNSEYEKDMFLTSEEAIAIADASTVVIVVDVNRPQITECPELLDICKTKVVIDHHRATSESVEGAVLSYVEPYASSASEMVAEILQYIDDSLKLKVIEADALYAGIIIDTDNFNNKSGVRTFEAAAYLRRHGADTTRVRKMLRNDMNEYMARAAAISKAVVYRDAYAISISDSEGLKSPTIVGAQAANELLNITGIKASFVVTPYNDKMYISARSIDEVNVQLVMEKLGGGGHMSIAGAQMQDCTADQAVQTIKNTLDMMLQDGEI